LGFTLVMVCAILNCKIELNSQIKPRSDPYDVGALLGLLCRKNSQKNSTTFDRYAAMVRCGDLRNAFAPIAYPHRGLAPRLVSHEWQAKSTKKLAIGLVPYIIVGTNPPSRRKASPEKELASGLATSVLCGTGAADRIGFAH